MSESWNRAIAPGGREQALELWRTVLASQVSHELVGDLSTRQWALLLTIYMDPPPHRVRDLAARLNLPKPAVTRAIDRLHAMGLVKRRREEEDRRSVAMHRTMRGAVLLTELAEQIMRARSTAATLEAPQG